MRVLPYAMMNKELIRNYIKKAVFDDNGNLLGDFYLKEDSEGNYKPQYLNGNKFYNLFLKNTFFKKGIFYLIKLIVYF